MENVSGDGKTSPFGNGKGATASGPSSGASNFVKNPAGNGEKGGGNDFLRNPRGNGTSGGGTDFVASPAGPGGKELEQKEGLPEDICDESIPAGGRILEADPPGNREGLLGDKNRSPFKLKG